MNELADKVAIITGGGYGIGKQIALKYGAAGAKVVIAARSVEPMKQTCAELERLGARAIQVSTDVSKEADCARMAAETIKAFGRIDILVNNAGISGPTKRITDMSLAEWQETIDIDLTGTWLATRAVLPAMDKQRAGNVINISSGAGRRGFPLRSPYAAAKWAMIGLTQTIAGEWGQRGIRCNCICPGAIEGDRIERVMRARAEALEAAVRTDQGGLPVAGGDGSDGDGGRSCARRAVPRARHVGGNDRSDDERRLRQHHELTA